jgi:hypothetical protein
MLSMDSPPLLEAPPAPTFSPPLEARIDAALAERLGRAPIEAERAAYRRLLWGLATVIDSILREGPT